MVGVNTNVVETTNLYRRGFTTCEAMATYVGMEFSEKLRILMEKYRYSQTDVAKAVDLSQSLVSLWTRGERVPDLPTAAKLAKLFSVDVNFLADDDQDEPPPQAELPDDERFILQMYRDLGLSRKDAANALVAVAKARDSVAEDEAGDMQQNKKAQ